MSDKKIIFRCTFPFGAPSEAERSIEDFKSRGRTVEFDVAGWKTPAVTEPVAPPAPKKSEPAPTFLYAPRTFDVKVWGADKGCAFKDTVASMAQPWDGRGP